MTGESAGDRENAVTELVRLAKLQEQRKREKRILYLIVLGVLIYNCVIGIYLFSGRGLFGGRDLACQVAGISMAGALGMLGRMDTLDSVWKALDRGTVLILLEAALGIAALAIQSRRSRSHASDSPRRSP